jgi:hypothetical protein
MKFGELRPGMGCYVVASDKCGGKRYYTGTCETYSYDLNGAVTFSHIDTALVVAETLGNAVGGAWTPAWSEREPDAVRTACGTIRLCGFAKEVQL